jgi:hypothetical protein
VQVRSSAGFGVLAAGFLAHYLPVALTGRLKLEHGKLGGLLGGL